MITPEQAAYLERLRMAGWLGIRYDLSDPDIVLPLTVLNYAELSNYQGRVYITKSGKTFLREGAS